MLRQHFADCRALLEIGSGTGQHAAHFAQALPQLHWQATDRDELSMMNGFTFDQLLPAMCVSRQTGNNAFNIVRNGLSKTNFGTISRVHYWDTGKTG